jgi:cobalamin biosynthesis protein CobD/CbiB
LFSASQAKQGKEKAKHWLDKRWVAHRAVVSPAWVRRTLRRLQKDAVSTAPFEGLSLHASDVFPGRWILLLAEGGSYAALERKLHTTASSIGR